MDQSLHASLPLPPLCLIKRSRTESDTELLILLIVFSTYLDEMGEMNIKFSVEVLFFCLLSVRNPGVKWKDEQSGEDVLLPKTGSSCADSSSAAPPRDSLSAFVPRGTVFLPYF